MRRPKSCVGSPSGRVRPIHSVALRGVPLLLSGGFVLYMGQVCVCAGVDRQPPVGTPHTHAV